MSNPAATPSATAAPSPGAAASGRLSGVIGRDWYASHVAVRLQDFFLGTTPWQRRLWDAGTVSALRELLEASRWRSEHVLSEGAVRWFARELERIVGTDPGVGDRTVKKTLAAELVSGVPFDTRHWRRLEQLVPRVEEGYLQRWSAAVDSAAPPAPGAERVARAVAAHLLDRGYSLAHLHAWVGRHVAASSQLGDLLQDADGLASQHDSAFQVLLPFEVMPRSATAAAQPNWLPAPAVKAWLSQHGGQMPGRTVRYSGAFEYEVEAKDPYAAARVVAGVLDRLLARVSYAPGYSKIRASEIAWVHPVSGPASHVGAVATSSGSGVPAYELRPTHRGTYVRSLVRVNKVHDVGLVATVLDDALELAASLNNSSSPGPAIANGWSALEALLFAPGDPQDSKDGRGAVASDRAAALVACSWPRAELTSLSHAHGSTHGALATPGVVGERAALLDERRGGPPAPATALHTLLAAGGSNRTRCEIVLNAFEQNERLELGQPSDVAAQERMLALSEDPKRTLQEVRGHVHHAFRRMYRMRNIVLHGGAASSSGLEVALRTVAPLVGAALARVAHSQLVDHVPPLALAARADLHLDLAGTPHGPGLADLLE